MANINYELVYHLRNLDTRDPDEKMREARIAAERLAEREHLEVINTVLNTLGWNSFDNVEIQISAYECLVETIPNCIYVDNDPICVVCGTNPQIRNNAE